jgi:hypothetical protein
LGHDRRFSRPERAKCAAARHPPPVSGIKEGFHTVCKTFATGRLGWKAVIHSSCQSALLMLDNPEKTRAFDSITANWMEPTYIAHGNGRRRPRHIAA